MISRHNNQEERLLSLEHNLLGMTNTIQGSHISILELKTEHERLNEITTRHETIIPRLRCPVLS